MKEFLNLCYRLNQSIMLGFPQIPYFFVVQLKGNANSSSILDASFALYCIQNQIGCPQTLAVD